jgi:hypothetical protein
VTAGVVGSTYRSLGGTVTFTFPTSFSNFIFTAPDGTTRTAASPGSTVVVSGSNYVATLNQFGQGVTNPWTLIFK